MRVHWKRRWWLERSWSVGSAVLLKLHFPDPFADHSLEQERTQFSHHFLSRRKRKTFSMRWRMGRRISRGLNNPTAIYMNDNKSLVSRFRANRQKCVVLSWHGLRCEFQWALAPPHRWSMLGGVISYSSCVGGCRSLENVHSFGSQWCSSTPSHLVMLPCHRFRRELLLLPLGQNSALTHEVLRAYHWRLPSPCQPLDSAWPCDTDKVVRALSRDFRDPSERAFEIHQSFRAAWRAHIKLISDTASEMTRRCTRQV